MSLLVKPANTQVLIIICDRGVEDDATFGTPNLDFTGGVGFRKNNSNGVSLNIRWKSQIVILFNDVGEIFI